MADKSNYDEIAERGILSIILNKPKLYLDIVDYISWNDFYRETHKAIFRSIDSLINEDSDFLSGLDPVIIRNKAIDLGYTNFDELTVNGKYIESLFARKLSEKSLLDLVRIVKDLSIKRGLKLLSSEISSIIDSDKKSVEIISEIELKVQEKVLDLSIKDEKVSILGDGFLEWANKKAEDPRQIVGIPTGFKRFDVCIGGGLRRGAVNLIAARPKTFKSGTCLNIAANLSVKNKIPTLILDTELRKEYNMARFGACISRVPINLIETGQWRTKKEYVDCIEQASEIMRNSPLYHVYVGGWPIDQILSVCRYWLTRYVGRRSDGEFRDCVILYDYIKLMKESDLGKNTEWQQLGFNMTKLHDFVAMHNVPMLTFAQLNRESEIAGADRLVWFASSYCVLERKPREEILEHGIDNGNMKMYIRMTRYGPGLSEDDYINFGVDFKTMYMEEKVLKSEINES